MDAVEQMWKHIVNCHTTVHIKTIHFVLTILTNDEKLLQTFKHKKARGLVFVSSQQKSPLLFLNLKC